MSKGRSQQVHKLVHKVQNVRRDGNQDFRYVKDTTATAIQIAQLTKSINTIFHSLSKCEDYQATNWKNQYSNQDERLLIDYLKSYADLTNEDQFKPDFEQLQLKDAALIQDALKSFNIFERCLWPIRLQQKFVSKLRNYSYNQIKYILGFLLSLGQGNFLSKQNLYKDIYGDVTPVVARCFPYNRFFTISIHKDKHILFNAGVQKLPICRSNSDNLLRHQYRSYLRFWTIIPSTIAYDPIKISQQVQMCLIKLREDAAKRDLSHELQIIPSKRYSPNQRFLFYVEENLQQNGWVLQTKFDPSQRYRYMPLVFKHKTYVTLQGLTYDKQLNRWVQKGHKNKMQEIHLTAYQRKINEELVKRFVDFQSAKALVDLLTKIPNFRIKLTQQQKSVIGQNGNVIVIGRSGTGKTTCAILRLFSIEMLFKIRLNLYKRKFYSTIKDTAISADEIDSTLGLHCIFLTASPVLTNEVQRYYRKITLNIKQELQKKRNRLQQEKKKKQQSIVSQQSFADLNNQSSVFQQLKENKKQQGHIEIDGQDVIPEQLKKGKSKEVIEQQAQIRKQFSGIQIKESFEDKQFQQNEEELMDNKFEENLAKFNSLHDLKQEDYPGFFTVKSFVRLIDGTLSSPFFRRNKKNEIVEADSKSSWHNQKKGTMKIENYYKSGNKNQEQLQAQFLKNIQQQFDFQDEQDLQKQYLRQVQMKQDTNKQELTKKLNERRSINKVFEVDYPYFVSYFWPTAHKLTYQFKHINAHLVWTEIFSTIKGSANCYKRVYTKYLDFWDYNRQSKNKFLTEEYRKRIYAIFQRYEQWKHSVGGYDFMDAVNYILASIAYHTYKGPEIHYVMIDQIQDLPNAIILLLSQVAQYGVFYSGDTAQTIAKGVGFRFVDLKKLFSENYLEAFKTTKQARKLRAPVIKQLTVNFRSHNNILQLANTLVATIQTLFPDTIDKLEKQTSDLDGPKPVILSEGGEEILFKFLSGENSHQEDSEQGKGFKKPQLQFGCDQVIIVRNQASKQKIPTMLQHALCLTIYEAKGLQFNDVILFNFFSDSECKDKWHIIKFLKTIDLKFTKEQYQKMKTKRAMINQQQDQEIGLEKLENPKLSQEQMIENLGEETIVIKKIVKDTKVPIEDRMLDYSDLNSQLKALYTAITRPRQNLIIYDEDPESRKSLQELWEKMGVVTIFGNKKVKKSQAEEEEQIVPPTLKSVVSESSRDQWKKQGFKMYSRGYYEQAKICFAKAGCTDLENNAHGFWLADKTSKRLIQIQAERNAIKQNFFIYQKMKKHEIKEVKLKLKTQQKIVHRNFIEAGQLFAKLKDWSHAGKCYFSGKDYQSAQACFVQLKMYKQAGQCLQMRNKFKEASQYYDLAGDYLKVIECLDLLNEWELILQKIDKYNEKMSQGQKMAFVKKYASLALESLVYDIQFENQDGSENKNMKGAKNPKLIQIIKQQQESQQDQSDEQQQVQQQQQSGQSAEQKEQPSQIEQLCEEQVKQEVKNDEKGDRAAQIVKQSQTKKQQVEQNSESFADLNQSSDKNEKQQISVVKSFHDKKSQLEQQKGLKSVESSFADLNQPEKSQSSFSDLNAQFPQQDLVPDIESIKSLVDVQDQWLRSVFSQSQIAKNQYSQSQYSIIDENQRIVDNFKIIKTKGNIFVQDEVMDKIVKIVSYVNVDAKRFFQQFKGHQSLITEAKQKKLLKNQPQNQPKPIISQFDQIDPEFINIILDTLQSFKLYKLCLFVCNRYFLPNKIGRYLLSIAMKYSTNCQLVNKITTSLLLPGIHRKTQIEKGIIASIALHSILQNVNPQFLKVKIPQSVKGNKSIALQNKQQSQKNLGCYFVNGLILLGLPKKAVFIVNPEQSLTILHNFFQYQTFNEIFKQKINKDKPIVASMFLQHPPQSEQEAKHVVFTLQKIYIEQYNYAYYMPFVSKKKLKEEGLVDLSGNLMSSLLKIPDYLPFTQALFKSDQAFVKHFQSYHQKAIRILNEGDYYQVYDVVYTLMVVLNKFDLQGLIVKKLPLEAFMGLYRCIDILKLSMNKFFGKNALIIVEAMLSIYKCRFVKPCKSMSFINEGFAFLDKTSNLLNHFIELQKQNSSLTYFFEQDFNIILVKAVQVVKELKKKTNGNIIRLWEQKINSKLGYHKNTFRQDYILSNEQIILGLALEHQVENIKSRHAQAKSLFENKKNKKKNKKLRNTQRFAADKVNYIMHEMQEYGMELDLTDSQQQQDIFKKIKEINDSPLNPIPTFSQALAPLKNTILDIFSIKTRKQKKLAYGKLLFCSGNNFFYRQYVQKLGGYNLFDAIQFKKFKRIDLYADNLLSVYDDIPVKQRHVYLTQILILLMVQLKMKTQGNKFTLRMHKKFFKFLDGLRTKQIVYLNQFNKIASKNQNPSKFNVLDVLNHQNDSKVYCHFTYHYLYTSQLTPKQLQQTIKDYFELAIADEQYSKHLDIKLLVTQYLINIPPLTILYEKLRNIVNRNQIQWKKDQAMGSLFNTKNTQVFGQKRSFEFIEEHKISSKEIFHQIAVTCKGNLISAVDQSQKDYQLQGKLIQKRRAAAIRIGKWWNSIMREKQVFFKQNGKRKAIKNDKLCETRLVRRVHESKVPYEHREFFLTKSSETRDQLLRYYLQNRITNSLDFHFILLSLNKIQDLRSSFVNLYKIKAKKNYVLKQQHKTYEKTQINDIADGLAETIRNIQLWKKDNNWKRIKNIDLKHKKAFELKWMTKGVNQSKKKKGSLKKIPMKVNGE